MTSIPAYNALQEGIPLSSWLNQDVYREDNLHYIAACQMTTHGCGMCSIG